MESIWSKSVCMPPDSVPYIGRYSERLGNFYVASGFQKWGMTGAMVAAEIISDMICGKENENAEVFSPKGAIRLRAVSFYATDFIPPMHLF